MTKHRDGLAAIPRPVIVLFCVCCVAVTLLGNLYQSSLYALFTPITNYVYGPIGFWQYGWGMYSFDLSESEPVRYVYTFPTGEPQYINSSYGFTPSFWRTELGNLDPSMVVSQNGLLAQSVLQYYCKNPQNGLPSPITIELQAANWPVPLISPAQSTTNAPVSFRTVTSVNCLVYE